MRRGESGLCALLAVDKPVGMTSHDVVSHVRRALGERRVGHAGTLDPLASGLLVVGVGQATRLMGLLTLDRKGYRAQIRWGQERTTDDAEGEVVREAPVPGWARDPMRAAQVVAGLVGEVDQVPPAYSAISVDGQRAYARARSGEDVELPARHVTIHEARLVGVDVDEAGQVTWTVDLLVSKGTYVRSIARDLGREGGSAAYVCGLRRLMAGDVTLADAVPLAEVEEQGVAVLGERSLDPARALGLPVRQLSQKELAAVQCGRRIAAVGPVERVSLVSGDALYGVWVRQGAWLVSELNVPQGVRGVRA